MWEKKFYHAILWLLFVSSLESRRYDVEEEARKLYKEDLKTVLTRFRRTPEYMSILRQKTNELQEDFTEIFEYIMNGHMSKDLQIKAISRLGINTEGGSERLLRNLPSPGNSTGKASTLPIEPVMERIGFREGGDVEGSEECKPTITKLESYSLLHSPLTVQQRNSMKDIAFEVVGDAIHDAIRNINGEGGSMNIKSTMQENFSDEKPGKSTHVREHKVMRSQAYNEIEFIPSKPARSHHKKSKLRKNSKSKSKSKSKRKTKTSPIAPARKASGPDSATQSIADMADNDDDDTDYLEQIAGYLNKEGVVLRKADT